MTENAPTSFAIDINADLTTYVGPNIRGAFGSGGGSGLFWTTDTTEAFWGEKGIATSDLPLAKTNDRFSRIHIDASRVSAIYKSTKLQPSALQLLACIRV